MSALETLSAIVSSGLWLGLLVFLRVGAAMTGLPGYGERTLSVRVRLVLAIMLTVAILPGVAARIEIPEASLPVLFRAVLTESVNGLFLGLVLRMFILALQTAGSIAAQSTSLSQLLGNAAADPMPAIGHILMVSALALLMATGFHVKAAVFLIISYDLLPPFQFPDPATIADTGSARISECFILAFGLAAPFVILSALYNVTLGFINKAMPQLMVAFVGAPVITFGSICMLLICAPVMLSVWLAAVDAFLSNPFR